jgi:hypothetical protein
MKNNLFKGLTKKKKIIYSSIAAASVASAVAIPIGVVYGSKKNNSDAKVATLPSSYPTMTLSSPASAIGANDAIVTIGSYSATGAILKAT